MAVLNATGETLVTSDGPKGNIGYPLKAPEIEFFLTMLDKTAERMTKEEKDEIRVALEEKAAEIEKARKR